METNMLIGILIGSGTVALLAFFAYRVKVSFDRVTRNHEDLNTDVYSSLSQLETQVDQMIENVDRSLNERVDDVYRTLDSRFDKTESRIISQVQKKK
jgi:tetrahydromethanopterin S-methyltransferase subunit B